MVTWPGSVASGAALMSNGINSGSGPRDTSVNHMQGGLRHCIFAYSSGAALLRAWAISFLFCLIENGPFGLWRRREAARAAQRPTVEPHIHSCNIIGGQPRSMRVAAAGILHSQECSMQGAGHLCPFCLLKNRTPEPSTSDRDSMAHTTSTIP